MIQKGMIVRCPDDMENMRFPRSFAVGKIAFIDDFSEKARIVFVDVNGISKYHEKPKDRDVEISKLYHCRIRKGAMVVFDKKKMVVCSSVANKEVEYFYYYIKGEDGVIHYVCETDLMVSYNDGIVSPAYQILTYEFQNPRWFVGRNIVSRTMNYIENSLYGFKDLAGCKIILKPHQLKTVMRCLQTKKCRYMLADEVGLGKTVEALSILKIFVKDNRNKSILIAVPDALVEQWKNELAFKFKLFEGENIGSNTIELIPISRIQEYINQSFDFVIFDEVHRCLNSETKYEAVLEISRQTENILMLSATPLQKRDDEFLRLLCLIQPEKYENMDKEVFQGLLEQQNKIIRKVFNALDELNALNDVLLDSNGEKNEETEEIFEAVLDELTGVAKIIDDDTFKQLLKDIDYESNDCGIAEFQSIIAYICENFQLEKSIIRNRRQKVNLNEDGPQIQRRFVDLSYEVNNEINNDEWNAYVAFSDWLENSYDGSLDYKNEIIPVINSLFSSAQAFKSKIINLNNKVKIPTELISASNMYAIAEHNFAKNFTEGKGNRISNIIGYIREFLSDEKVILFTNFSETFNIYKEILIRIFGQERCCFFNKTMDSDELELNAYRFQTEESRTILLSDESGGEGRNFQQADCLIHIDIPWNANDIEQRIGRLDRIGRDVSKDVVSIVVYGKDTVEENLFKLWNEGLSLFSKAQSGLEIIMGDIENEIITCLQSSFKYGLEQAHKEMSVLIKEQLDALKKEQVYDIAAYQFKTINRMLDDTVEKYTKNETNLFGEAMMGWASLSGFHGKKDGEDVTSFSQNSISIKSLSNTLFMPPDMKSIIDSKINQLRNRVRVLNMERLIHSDNSYIRGTFNRQKALTNDYLNFFAPGDDIFDAITQNALNSYKGTCSAFACKADINWSGFVFTWKFEIDESVIYKNKLNEHIIDQYKGYLPSEQIVTVYDMSDSRIDDNRVVSAFLSVVQNSYAAKIKHLGKREGEPPALLKFIKTYPPSVWKEYVKTAHKESRKKAKLKAETKKKPLLNALHNELSSTLSAQKAASIYYGDESDFEMAKKQNDIVFEMIQNAGLVLDSICFVVMMNE